MQKGLRLKVLDVDSLQSGIDAILKDVDAKREQIKVIQKAVHSFYSLEDALKVQGGNAIRSFYKVTHEPFWNMYINLSVTLNLYRKRWSLLVHLNPV